jgi:hypothetical protein
VRPELLLAKIIGRYVLDVVITRARGAGADFGLRDFVVRSGSGFMRTPRSKRRSTPRKRVLRGYYSAIRPTLAFLVRVSKLGKEKAVVITLTSRRGLLLLDNNRT